ncbi:hypothetical protein KAI32_02850 [Candidatus Pacearchaeota archaeon]|nr:hypothetical protein [Candidatus Pacearchaeota archaeon]
MKISTRNLLIEYLKKCEFVNPPKKMEIYDYALAEEEYLKLINMEKDKIKSIYKFGSIGALGISDIDYLIVFKNTKRDSIGKYHIMNLSNRSRYLFCHNALFINENVFKKLPYWFPFFKLNLVWGEKLYLAKSPSKDINLLLTTQYFINKIPKDLLEYAIVHKKINQRIILAIIYSLKHTNSLLERLGVKNKKRKDFFEKFGKFRSNWFNESDKKNKLISYLSEAVQISLEFMEIFDKILINKFNIKSPETSFKIRINDRNLYFLSNWNKDSYIKKMFSHPRDYQYLLSFGYYLYLWKHSKTFLGKRIAKDFPRDIVYQIPWEIKKLFKIHSETLEEYNNFCRKKFKTSANEYHVLWTKYYSNPFINWIHEKFVKFEAIIFILINRIKQF